MASNNNKAWERDSIADHMFMPLLLTVLVVAIGGGLAMRQVKPAAGPPRKMISQRLRTTLLIEDKPEPAPVAKPAPVQTEPVMREKKSEPVDLTDNPKLAQQRDEKVDAPKSKPVRRVYGLKKVYSRGIGAGGSMADAVVGKLGNTLAKEFDTLQATQQEIKGAVVSTTTVTSAPRFRKRVKPDYTQDMLANQIEGVVKVKVLIDIDGKVKKALALNDIGYDAARQAVAASLRMEFEPAKRGKDPVAVWIIVPIRFVMLS